MPFQTWPKEGVWPPWVRGWRLLGCKKEFLSLYHRMAHSEPASHFSHRNSFLRSSNSHPLTQGGQTTSLGHVWKGIIYPSLKRPKCEIYGELYSQDTCLAWVSLMFEYVHWCSCHSRFSFFEIYGFLVILNSSPHGKWAVFRGASSLNLCRNVQR